MCLLAAEEEKRSNVSGPQGDYISQCELVNQYSENASVVYWVT